MEYISVKEFLSQPKKVQEVFMEWWNPSKGDVYCNLYNGQEDNVLVINQCQFNFKSFKDDIKRYGIPLLTEGQLRNFIEDKTSYIIKNNQYHTYNSELTNEGYTIYLLNIKKTSVAYFYTNLGKDLLQAYWKVACKVANKLIKEQ